jgi:aryl-alcohol dehydrogenase-like predicted oxidoreductase
VVGTARIGSPFVGWSWDQAATFRYLDALVDLGLVAFDLAASYQVGGTERLFGAWLSKRGRSRIFLTTKGGHPLPVVAPHRLGKKALTSDLEASLSRLRTDRIDLYWLHRDDEHTPLDEIVQTLAGFQKAGKIAAYGLSNWRHGRVEALRQVARSQNLAAPIAVSPHYSLFEWMRPPWPGCVTISGDRAALVYYQEAALPIFAWSPLCGGFSDDPRASGGIYDSPQNQARRKRLLELAAARQVTPTGLLLAYLKQRQSLTFPIVASRNVERMAQNLRALELPLDQSDLEFLEGDPASGPSGGA